MGNLLDNTSNQPSRFKTKNWVKITDESRGLYTADSDIKFKTTLLKPSLCDSAEAYILVKGTITITGGQDPQQEELYNLIEYSILYNLIEYSDNYSKTCGRLSQYYEDELNDDFADSE